MTSETPWKRMPDAYRIARIRTMIEDGSSSSVIAAEMGTTRSAICGFCHRKGISLTGLQGVPKAAPRKPSQKARARSITAPAPLPEDEDPAGDLAEPAQAHAVEAAPEACIPLADAPADPAPAGEAHQPVHFLERTAAHCWRPLWGRNARGIEDKFVCGAPPRKPGGVCQACAAILYTTPEKQKAASKKHKARKPTGRQSALGLVA